MVENYVKLYKELAKLPIPTSAYCFKNRNNLTEIITTWDQRDIPRMTRTPYKVSYIYDSVKKSVVAVSSPVETNNETLYSFSKDGLLAIVRKTTKSGVDKKFIEIWKGGCKFKTIDVLAKEKHSNIITNGQFGCLSWAPNSTHLVYTAEKYVKTESFFAAAEKTAKGDKETGPKVESGQEFLYRQSWGETLQDVISPLLFTVNIETEEVEQVPAQSDDVSYGRACWVPDGTGIVCIGWCHVPYKLGLIYCSNRRSAVYHFDIKDQSSKIISASEHSVNEGLWFSPTGDALLYMQSAANGPHRGVQSLMKIDWASKQISEIIKKVSEPEAPDNFPGIYSVDLPKRIWIDDEHVVFHSICRSKQELFCVNIKTSKLTRLTNDEKIGERILLDCYENLIVAIESAPNLKPIMVVGNFVSDRGEKTVKWVNLEPDCSKRSVEINWSIQSYQPTSDMINLKFPNLEFESILLTPQDSSMQPFPLIVIPHGGPHSTICGFYSLGSNFFCRLGCAVLYVNYRGSLGFGQNNIDSLPGNIGTQDVKDVQFAVDSVLKNPIIDSKNVFVSSGSHGGFLALSLAGTYPDKYKRIVARNPVTAVHDMAGISDIPDWNFVESGLPFDFTSVAHKDDVAKMYSVSPIRLVDNIKIPVLFLLGNGDLRVPCHQGLLMHRALKARNIETKVYMYNDNHALSHLDTESDSLIQIASWILKP